MLPNQSCRSMEPLNFEIDPRIEYARTLPARCYNDAAYLQTEQRRIFNRSWQLVGRLEDLADCGAFLTATIGTEEIVVVRDLKGELRGFFNLCRHRAGPIARGSGKCDNFRCGYHGWTYDLTGRLIGLPDFDGVCEFEQGESGLIPIEVSTWEQFVFVRLSTDRNLPSLPAMLGDIPDLTSHAAISRLSFAGRRDYLIECNWKVYVDNYVEGYHVPIVHPRLMGEIDYRQYRTITSRYHSLQDAPIRAGAADGKRHYAATERQKEALYFWVFPNLMLNIYPDNLSTNLIVPLGPTRTLTIFEWFFEDVDSAVARERIAATIELSDEIQREDMAICEEVQRRLQSSAYDRGRYSPTRENGLHHFHSLWMEWMHDAT